MLIPRVRLSAAKLIPLIAFIPLQPIWLAMPKPLPFYRTLANIVLTGVIEYQLGEVGKVSVFPNPAKNFVTVFGEDISNAEVIVSLKDILGRQLHTEKLKTMNQSFTTKLDISLMPSGIYFIEIKAGSSSLVEKISVSKG